MELYVGMILIIAVVFAAAETYFCKSSSPYYLKPLHLLLTRFNVRFTDWKTVRDGSAPLTDQWLVERLDLWKKYCLPSVVNQTCRDFRWCIIIDRDTSNVVENEIVDSIGSAMPYRILRVDVDPNLASVIAGVVQELLLPDQDIVITSRLDNDDAIHESFIEKVQSAAEGNLPKVIDCRVGLQLSNFATKKVLRRVENNFNPFVSLVESASELKTVFQSGHKQLQQFANVEEICDSPLWLEVIHERNKLNYVRKNLPVQIRPSVEAYHIDQLAFWLPSINRLINGWVGLRSLIGNLKRQLLNR